MNDFEKYLQETGEIGYVEQIFPQIVYVGGLPSVKIGEVVLFENDAKGYVIALEQQYHEVLLLTDHPVSGGERVVATRTSCTVRLGTYLLGATIGPLDMASPQQGDDVRLIDSVPMAIQGRMTVAQSLETGVPIVDLLIPLGKGQRELIIGDRKIGKTSFLQTVAVTQARLGAVCIYSLIGKKEQTITKIKRYFADQRVLPSIVLVTSKATDPAGLIYLTPYTAMTVAEYFRDQGYDVVVMFDDLTTHARVYREISLLSRRFPGRNSYPGDIFYAHARLLERGGSFTKGTISCLPAAETLAGELSGYIQTNIMSITDGHIFFDKVYFNEGRRPAVNPYLSVTRVGRQAQSALIRSISRELSRFLTEYKRMKEFLHFGSEVGDQVLTVLAKGEQIVAFFDAFPMVSVPMTVSCVLVGLIWSGYLREQSTANITAYCAAFMKRYATDAAFQKTIQTLVAGSTTFEKLIDAVNKQPTLFAFSL